MSEQTEPAERTANEHLTFAEAGARLGLSPDAVRMRAKRGNLATVRIGGRPYVLWPQPAPAEHANEPRTERTAFANRSAVQGEPRLVAALEDRIASLERQLAERTEEIRRRDHIIAGFVERLPELPVGESMAQDAPGTHESSPQRGAVAVEASDTRPSAWRRWWRRMTGGGG
jgi:hypothetical protein